jgi:predicted permease
VIPLLHDLRCGYRVLARERSFTTITVLTLALCLSANTAMFGIVRAVLFEPLPFPESSRVVLLYNSYPNAGAPRAGTSVPDYFDRLAAVPGLEQQGLYRLEGMTYGDENGVERLASIRATPSFFRVIGVRPASGRLFRDDKGEPGRALKVILSHAFWMRKLGGRADVVGRTMRLNGNAFDVVGIMPRESTFLQNNIDVYVPAPLGPADRGDDRRHSNNWQMVARLRRGATLEQVTGQLDALNASNDRRFPEFRQILADAGFHTVVVRLQDDVVRDVRAVLYLLWGGVVFVLLIGCLNVANLIVVRASARRRELAARFALGGSFSRLARQIIAETMLLASAGGALGILAGWWILRSLARIDFDKLPRGYEVDLDPWALGAACCAIVVIGVALGGASVLAVRRMNVSAELQRDDRGGHERPSRQRHPSRTRDDSGRCYVCSARRRRAAPRDLSRRPPAGPRLRAEPCRDRDGQPAGDVVP